MHGGTLGRQCELNPLLGQCTRDFEAGYDRCIALCDNVVLIFDKGVWVWRDSTERGLGTNHNAFGLLT